MDRKDITTSNWLNAVFFTDANTGYIAGNCGNILKTINGGGMGMIENPLPTKYLKIYPNPAQETVTLELTDVAGVSNLSIFSADGRELINQPVTNKNTVIDIRSLRSGIYFVRLVRGKTVETGKIVVK
jgi:hypothetical protein